MILKKKQQEIEELAKKVGETQDIKDIRQQFCGFKAGITFAKEEILKEIDKFDMAGDKYILFGGKLLFLHTLRELL